MVETIEELQHELLEGEYDVVLVTDVDEIVTPTPEWGTLGEYLDEFDRVVRDLHRLRDPAHDRPRGAI